MDEHRSPASETCLWSIIPDYPILNEQYNTSNVRKCFNRAPHENKHPVSLMTDELCEELASISSIAPNGQIWLYCRMTHHISHATDQVFSSDFKFR